MIILKLKKILKDKEIVMKYIGGIFGLNLTCELGTPGDWHRSSINWSNAILRIKESDDSIFKDFGINSVYKLPPYLVQYIQHEIFPIANHLRCCLDFLEYGQYSYFQGMYRNFLCTKKFNTILFEKFLLLRNLPKWNKIDKVIGMEFRMEWVNFKKEQLI